MKTQFTKGEWELTDNNYYLDVRPKVENDYGGTICSIFDSEHIDRITIEERNANAKLITAAPKMYEAIYRALSICDLWMPPDDVSLEFEGEAIALQSMKNELEQAIKKATE